jgi:hypothetical protein
VLLTLCGGRESGMAVRLENTGFYIISTGAVLNYYEKFEISFAIFVTCATVVWKSDLFS